MQIAACVAILSAMLGTVTASSPKRPPLPPPVEYYRTVGLPPARATPTVELGVTRPSAIIAALSPAETTSNNNLYKSMKCELKADAYDTKAKFTKDYGLAPQDSVERSRYVYYRLWCPPIQILNLTLDVKEQEFVGKDLAKLWGNPVAVSAVRSATSAARDSSPTILREGTICSISFVKDVLFPYALRALPQVLADSWHDPAFAPYRDAFPVEARGSPAALEAHVRDLTERDVKVASLKNLQGYLWQSGYETGAYVTPLFPDVVPRLREWKGDDTGLELVIFSSGSVFAQKLLFKHVRAASCTSGGDSDLPNDLTGLISGWFDTVNAGPKTVPESYDKIAAARAVRTEQVAFFSDNVKEVAAAEEAGMKTVLVDRPGNAPLSEGDRRTYGVATSLDQVQIARVDESGGA